MSAGLIDVCDYIYPHKGIVGVTNQHAATYRAWQMMRHRCNNPSAPNYAYYGGIGVSVCSEWESFAAFFDHMGPRPSLKPSLDRHPNPHGDYEPGNCRWATRPQQQRNRRDNYRIEYGGLSLTASEWVERLKTPGLTSQALRRRVLDYHWAIERALFTPRTYTTPSVAKREAAKTKAKNKHPNDMTAAETAAFLSEL